MLHHTQPRPLPADDNRSLSKLFDDVLSRHAGQSVRIGVLMGALHERGFGVLLILFALPLCIPIPKPPPFDTLLGLPLFYLCAQMILGRDVPYLPHTITKRHIHADMLIAAFRRGRKWLERAEKLFHPRLTGMHERTLSRICGVFGMICTTSVLVPFPFTNTIPSICVAIMAMGLVMRDGVAALLGGLAGVVFVAGLAAVFILGATHLLDLLPSVFG